MFLGESHERQCKILTFGENGSSLKCNLNAAEAAHHQWELILNVCVWKVRGFQLFMSKLSLYNLKKLQVLSILQLHFSSLLFA